jgi:hypothetical protein
MEPIHPSAWKRRSRRFITCTVADRVARIQGDVITLYTNITHWGMRRRAPLRYGDAIRESEERSRHEAHAHPDSRRGARGVGAGVFSAAGTMPKEVQAASKQKYTAIAAIPSLVTGAWANGYTKNEAKRKALHICRTEAPKYPGYEGDCQGASWVKNGHVALAFEKTIE